MEDVEPGVAAAAATTAEEDSSPVDLALLAGEEQLRPEEAEAGRRTEATEGVAAEATGGGAAAAAEDAAAMARAAATRCSRFRSPNETPSPLPKSSGGDGVVHFIESKSASPERHGETLGDARDRRAEVQSLPDASFCHFFLSLGALAPRTPSSHVPPAREIRLGLGVAADKEVVTDDDEEEAANDDDHTSSNSSNNNNDDDHVFYFPITVVWGLFLRPAWTPESD